MKTRQEDKTKIQSLQAVRALAFLGIFTCHAGLNQLGAWGASVFLVLSGFLMVYTYFDREVETSPKRVVIFVAKKLWKLYPLHLLMMVAALPFAIKVLLENMNTYQVLRLTGQVGLNVLLLQSWIPKSAAYFSLNGVTWYLSVCAFLYLMFPYILKGMKRFSSKWNAYLSIVILFGIQFGIAFLLRNVYVPMSVSDNLAKWVTYIWPVFRLGDFLIGCNLGYLFLKHRIQPNKAVVTLGEVLVVIMLVVSQKIYVGQYGFFSSEWFTLTVMNVPGAVLLIYLAALNQGWITRLITNRPLVFLGDISGYAFLIHQIVIRYVRELMLHVPTLRLSNWGVAGVSFGITLLLAVLYSKLIMDRTKNVDTIEAERKEGAAA